MMNKNDAYEQIHTMLTLPRNNKNVIMICYVLCDYSSMYLTPLIEL